MTGDDRIKPLRAHQNPNQDTRPHAPRFDGPDDFRCALRQRVDAYFGSTGLRRRDCPSMYVKSIVVLCCLGVSYSLLVFAPVTWWLAIPLTVALGLSLAALGFNNRRSGWNVRARAAAFNGKPVNIRV